MVTPERLLCIYTLIIYFANGSLLSDSAPVPGPDPGAGTNAVIRKRVKPQTCLKGDKMVSFEALVWEVITGVVLT